MNKLKKKASKTSASVSQNSCIDNQTVKSALTEEIEKSVLSEEGQLEQKSLNYQNFFEYIKKDGDKVGICLLCRKSGVLKEIKMKNSNTSGLKYHLSKNHSKEHEQLFGSKQNKRNNTFAQQQTIDTYINTKSEVNWDRTISAWLSYKNLPLNFFNDEVTQHFFKSLNPNVSMPKRNTTKEKLICEFGKMQTNLIEILQKNSSKFSFAIDAWSAPNGQSYYGITIHFFDNDWNHHSPALDFVPSMGNHTGKDIANIFFNVLKNYNIQNKVQGITVDNAAANSTFIHELKKLMDSENIDFDIEDNHFRCFSHIMNLGVQDVLKLINIETESIEFCKYKTSDVNDDTDDEDLHSDGDYDDVNIEEDKIFSNVIIKIRKTCKKVRFSEQLTNRLKLFCEAVDIRFHKLILDVRTRWDSTYDMLHISFQLKPALVMLWENCSELNELKVTEVEWIYLEKILNFLKHFKHVSKILGSEKEVTLPTAVIAFNMLVDKIEKVVLELDNNLNRNANDETLLLAFQTGRDKILKHYRKCNWVYCIALILDPRHKIECFDATKWGKELKKQTISKFEKLYKKEYYTTVSDNVINEDNVIKSLDDDDNDDLIDFESIFLTKSETADWRKEIDEYCQAQRATKDTNIMQWWKSHMQIYPNLAKMARNILSIQASSVSVERLFSQASLIMRNRRASLKSETMKALICTNSWMKSSLKLKICEVDL